jgi:pyridoxine/pyridoxamine 5'-phosphate oxidase
VPHWETAAELGILDAERATKISGSMFTMQRGAGATLARALCQLALDRNADAFEEIRPPSLVLTSTLTATGQLPKFADDAFAIERDDLWCIPTAEVPLTSLYAGEILDEAELPIRMMAYTPCYRREAGSAGRDTRGMLRTHEFDKVEILAVSTPEQAPDLLDEMRRTRRGHHRRTRACRTGSSRSAPATWARAITAASTSRSTPRVRPVARGLVGELVQRLSGPPRRRPVPTPRRRRQPRQGHRDRPHAQRLGPGRASGLGGHRREPPPARRLGHVPEVLRPYMRGIDRIEPGRDGPMTDWSTGGRPTARCCAIAASSTRPPGSTRRPRPRPDRAVAALARRGVRRGVAEPNAIVLATVDTTDGTPDATPDARIVLVRGADHRGFTFFTNYRSAKSRQLDGARGGRRVLVARPPPPGAGQRLDHRSPAAESDEYFASRPRASQIGAWASPQSGDHRESSSPRALVAEVEERFGGVDVPRPPHWGGWRLVPSEWEFWQGRPEPSPRPAPIPALRRRLARHPPGPLTDLPTVGPARSRLQHVSDPVRPAAESRTWEGPGGGDRSGNSPTDGGVPGEERRG